MMTTYNVYAAPWGQPISAINFTTPIAVVFSAPVIVNGLRGSQTSGTRYLAVRKSVDGIEEKNWNIITFALTNGDWNGNFPAAPYHLSARVLEDDRVELTWQYQLGTVTPDGFHIYSGVGSVNYSTPILTITYQEGIQQQIVPAITTDTLFAVRAYRGNNIEQNTGTVLVALPATLVAVEGEPAETWRDQ